MPSTMRTLCLLRCSTPRILVVLLSISALSASGPVRAAENNHKAPASAQAFLKQHCVDCHAGKQAEAGLDLSTISNDLSAPGVGQKWVRIWDRVDAGEMPPADVDQPPVAERSAFVHETGAWIRNVQLAQQAELGRVQSRRLTHREIERSLHDALGIDIPLANLLADESRSQGFDTIAETQSISHFHLGRHLVAIDTALDEAYRRAFSPPDNYQRDFDAEGVSRTNPQRRCREPEMLNGQAVIWSSGLMYYGRTPATTAREDGWYRFQVTASALNPPKSGGVWATVSSGPCISSAPLLMPVTAFEATTEPQTIEFEAWLPKEHMLEIRPGDTTIKKARFAGGQVGAGEGEPQNVPGIAFDRITMQQFHKGADDAQLRQLLFGDLKIKLDKRSHGELISKDPRAAVTRLMRDMARRVFRRPTTDAELAGYTELALTALDNDDDIAGALRTGYRALFCSPRFLYLTESPGPLDSYAIASRLSYLLTGGLPDEQLTTLADADQLRDPAVIRSEVNRLLSGDGARQFVEDFGAQWLELDQISFTEPDRKQYPTFDGIVEMSMLDETHAFLEEMLRKNSSVTKLISADHTYLNSRLARYYGIPGVTGHELRRVALKPESHRGGVLTQGAILKVTANGSTTSPVLRGVWVSERLLGVPIPPPPSSVPAIEPDIRGAKTVREQLEKHRSQPECASCHVHIDPPGYALENFDPSGQWRSNYLQVVKGKNTKGAKIDASYVLADGREFTNVDDFRTLIVAKPQRVAGNVAEQLLVYGTGAAMTFADREFIEQIVEETAHTEYGFRSIIEAVVTSPVFLKK